MPRSTTPCLLYTSVCGIDYEEGRNYSDASSNDGMTDMILYCKFAIKNGALHMRCV